MLGRPKPDAPEWCGSKWCYVHREICDRTDVKQSMYFGEESDLWYSYEKCGNADLYTAQACLSRTTEQACTEPCVWMSGKCFDQSPVRVGLAALPSGAASSWSSRLDLLIHLREDMSARLRTPSERLEVVFNYKFFNCLSK